MKNETEGITTEYTGVLETVKQSPITHFGDKLKQWQPGQSGNPLGRPKKQDTITSLVKDILDQVDGKTKKTYAQLVAEAMVRGALKDPQILKELLNRCEGKVREEIDMQTTGVSILYELVRGRDDK